MENWAQRRRRKLEEVLQGQMQPSGYTPDWNTQQLQKQLNRDPFGNIAPFMSPAPVMQSGMMQNPSLVMGGGMNGIAALGQTQQAAPGFGQMPLPQGGPSPDMPAPMATNAGPAPMPPQRPAYSPAQQPAAPMPPQRPEGLGSNDIAALISGYNAQAFRSDPQAVANQFAEGDPSKLGARTYRNEDGSMWNDYYLR